MSTQIAASSTDKLPEEKLCQMHCGKSSWTITTEFNVNKFVCKKKIYFLYGIYGS